jgi:beta-glucanase (GH16 family)
LPKLGDRIEYRYSGWKCPGSATKAEVVRSLKERIMAMSKCGNPSFVLRFGFVLAIVFLSLAGSSRANAQGSDCASNSVPNDPQGNVIWTPAFCQEFNSTVVGPPDITVWSFDLGNSGFGNHEIETYCGPPNYSNNPNSCPTTFSPNTSNAYIDGSGHLLIQAFTTGGSWYSARMKTQGLVNFQFGRIEGRIQLPDTTNQGLWPAFWSLGSNIATVPWPGCGEADILEVWSPAVLGGPGPTGNRSTLHTATTDGSGVQPNGQFTFPNGQANNSAFHTYGMIWSANMQQYYIDNPLKPYYIATASDLKSGDTWPFNLNMFLIMNVAVGGTLGGTPGASTPNPGVMMVDYVRQYQPAAAVTKPTLGNPPSITVKAGVTTGNSSTFTPGLTSGTGFVYFSCSTSAPKASCSVATNDPLNTHIANSSPMGAAETVTVTVATTANAALPPFSLDPRIHIWMPITIAGLLVLLLLVLALRGQARVRRQLCGIAALLILVGVAMAGCGGSSPPPPPPPPNGTPPGSYTVTVYAFTESNNGDGTNATADANVAIPLTVN